MSKFTGKKNDLNFRIYNRPCPSLIPLLIKLCKDTLHIIYVIVNCSRYDGYGNFELAQELELSSSDGDAGAEILVSADGKFVYCSSRISGVVLVYQLEADNSLIKIQEYTLAGIWPRSMAIRDNRMVVVDRINNIIQYLYVDTTTGMISGSSINIYPTPASPTFVDFLD